MKAIDLQKRTKDELKELLKEEREKLTKLRFDLAAGKVKNVREIRLKKKDIARILTVLKSKK